MMSGVNRRSFIAGSATLMAAPAIGANPRTTDVDVIIVGAGAAGIAAGRRISAAKKSFVILEASHRIGGRCVTDNKLFGLPFDLGAHWIHNTDKNPLLTALPTQSDLDVYTAPRNQRMHIGQRFARDAELENFIAALARARHAISALAHTKADMPASRALPKDLGEWQAPIEFILGAYACGKDLDQVSALDLALVSEREKDSFCRQGYGTLLATLAANLPIQLSTPATKIKWGNGLSIETTQGSLRAQAAIITVSVNVLTSRKIVFIPALPERQHEVARQLSLGSLDHIALEMLGNPLDLQEDDLIFERTNKPNTAALLANVSGSTLHLVDVGGAFGRALAAQGEAAMINFASEWLTALFGSNVKKAIRRSQVTRWNNEPWVLGAMSAAAAGEQRAHRILMEPLDGRIFLAGEAVHETEWGTVTGAWDSGTRAAELTLRRIGALGPAQGDSPAQRTPKQRLPRNYR
jgi:monoamine oxidase